MAHSRKISLDAATSSWQQRSNLPFSAPSNLKRRSKLLFSAKLHHGCSVDATLQAYAYFSLPQTTGEPNDTRMCLLSLSFQFIPGQDASIANFSISVDFAREYVQPPIVQGFKFLGLEETVFHQDFQAALEMSPSRLGSEWYNKRYEDLLFGSQDLPFTTGKCQTYIWGERRQKPSLTIRGDGFVGAPNCAVHTIPVCILLAFPEPLPPKLSADISLRARITRNTERSFPAFRQAVVSSSHMQDLLIANGPELSVCPGDPYYHRLAQTISWPQTAQSTGPRSILKQTPSIFRDRLRKKTVRIGDLPGDNETSASTSYSQLTKKVDARPAPLPPPRSTSRCHTILASQHPLQRSIEAPDGLSNALSTSSSIAGEESNLTLSSTSEAPFPRTPVHLLARPEDLSIPTSSVAVVTSQSHKSLTPLYPQRAVHFADLGEGTSTSLGSHLLNAGTGAANEHRRSSKLTPSFERAKDASASASPIDARALEVGPFGSNARADGEDLDIRQETISSRPTTSPYLDVGRVGRRRRLSQLDLAALVITPSCDSEYSVEELATLRPGRSSSQQNAEEPSRLPTLRDTVSSQQLHQSFLSLSESLGEVSSVAVARSDSSWSV